MTSRLMDDASIVKSLIGRNARLDLRTYEGRWYTTVIGDHNLNAGPVMAPREAAERFYDGFAHFLNDNEQDEHWYTQVTWEGGYHYSVYCLNHGFMIGYFDADLPFVDAVAALNEMQRDFLGLKDVAAA